MKNQILALIAINCLMSSAILPSEKQMTKAEREALIEQLTLDNIKLNSTNRKKCMELTGKHHFASKCEPGIFGVSTTQDDAFMARREQILKLLNEQ